MYYLHCNNAKIIVITACKYNMYEINTFNEFIYNLLRQDEINFIPMNVNNTGAGSTTITFSQIYKNINLISYKKKITNKRNLFYKLCEIYL